MNNPGLCITGMGIIAPIGTDATSCFHALTRMECGIGPMRLLDSIHRDRFPVGEVRFTNSELLDLNNIPKQQAHRYTRTTLLAIHALRETISSAGLDPAQLKEIPLISASSVGGMDRTENEHDPDQPGISGYQYTHPCGDHADAAAAYLGIEAYRSTISTACSSGANALIHAAGLIRSGLAEIVIAGGADALCRFTVNGFNSLMILDTELCRPFDNSRNGLNLGEGAAYLVLESESSARKRAAKILCRLSGYANTNDAHHQTASSPEGEGAYLSMSQALQRAGLEPAQIGYINVHGTGTQNNDLSEGIAMRRIFGENVPPFSSTKTLTGHALGAAASLEAVFSILALRNNLLLPHPRFHTPVEETGLTPVTAPGTAELEHVLSNSFGFGGNNSTLIFSH